MDWLSAPLTMLFVCIGIYLLFELFARRGERKMLIEKMAEVKDVDVNRILAPFILNLARNQRKGASMFSSLRIGLVAVGIGLGLIVGAFLVKFLFYDNWEMKSMVYTACLCIFGGIGFMVSFIIEYKYGTKDATRKEEKEGRGENREESEQV